MNKCVEITLNTDNTVTIQRAEIKVGYSSRRNFSKYSKRRNFK